VLKLGATGAVGSAAIVALALLLSPALAASNQKAKKSRAAPSFSAGGFTPAVVDPRLAAEFARRGFQPGSYRFTPSSASADKSKAIKVAVRARAVTTAQAARVLNETASSPVTAVTPSAYNLGLSVGWKRFALSGDVAKVQGGAIPGGRQAAEVGVSYSGKKFTGQVNVGAERSDGAQQRIVPLEENYSLDVGGSYDVGRNIALTGGVRYKIQRDRLQPLADDRRDSQAVYIGTAFRF
jgi:hypothetical protein